MIEHRLTTGRGGYCDTAHRLTTGRGGYSKLLNKNVMEQLVKVYFLDLSVNFHLSETNSVNTEKLN